MGQESGVGAFLERESTGRRKGQRDSDMVLQIVDVNVTLLVQQTLKRRINRLRPKTTGKELKSS